MPVQTLEFSRTKWGYDSWRNWMHVSWSVESLSFPIESYLCITLYLCSDVIRWRKWRTFDANVTSMGFQDGKQCIFHIFTCLICNDTQIYHHGIRLICCDRHNHRSSCSILLDSVHYCLISNIARSISRSALFSLFPSVGLSLCLLRDRSLDLPYCHFFRLSVWISVCCEIGVSNRSALFSVRSSVWFSVCGFAGLSVHSPFRLWSPHVLTNSYQTRIFISLTYGNSETCMKSRTRHLAAEILKKNKS